MVASRSKLILFMGEQSLKGDGVVKEKECGLFSRGNPWVLFGVTAATGEAAAHKTYPVSGLEFVRDEQMAAYAVGFAGVDSLRAIAAQGVYFVGNWLQVKRINTPGIFASVVEFLPLRDLANIVDICPNMAGNVWVTAGFGLAVEHAVAVRPAATTIPAAVFENANSAPKPFRLSAAITDFMTFVLTHALKVRSWRQEVSAPHSPLPWQKVSPQSVHCRCG